MAQGTPLQTAAQDGGGIVLRVDPEAIGAVTLVDAFDQQANKVL